MDGLSDQKWAGQLRQARDELDVAIRDIRQLRGYERFLDPAGFDDAAAVSQKQPLIYLAATFTGGLALCVGGGRIVPVSLPALSERSVVETTTDYAQTYQAWRRDPSGRVGEWRDCLDRTGRWLWDAVAGPLLEAMPLSSATFIPCGRLGFLPLHAAWVPADTATGRRYMLDTTIVSYVPNARALRAAGQIRDEVMAERVLAVVDPLPTDERPLPFARSEVAAAVETFGASRVLERGEASIEEFREVVGDADVFHFAGHGLSYLDDPMNSALLFANDKQLSLRDIFALPVRLRLAVLSACETGISGRTLPDEVVGLPTGLLQAGAAGVVATQWAVEDAAAAMVVADFYRRWRLNRADPAAALCQAQCWVRDSTNGEKASMYATAHQKAPVGWLTPAAASALHAKVAYEDPERRGHESIDLWAAFAHYGV